MTGLTASEIFFIRPDSSAIFISPLHTAIIPARDIMKCTASVHPDIRLSVNSDVFPFATEKHTPATSIAPHI